MIDTWFVYIALLLLVGLIAIGGGYIRRLRRRSREYRAQIQRLEVKKQELQSRVKRRGRRLDVLFSSVNEAIFRVNQQGMVLAANRQAQHVFRPGEELALPQPMVLFYRDPGWQQRFSEALSTQESSSLPDMHVNGQVLAARLTPLTKKQALLLCVDMTRQATLERQRQTFLANMMHDLKTPLTTMLGYARSIQAFTDNPKLQQESAEIIANEAKHVSSLLDSLLLLDRIENIDRSAGSNSLLSTACAQVSVALSFQCQKREVTIRIDLPEKEQELSIALEDLCRVLMNILLNAIQHSPKGAVVDLRVEIENDSYRICIDDDGPGIPEQHLGRVMDRFYRVEKERSRNGEGGHGLGLAIVRELLEASGGKVHLQNRDAHGLQVELRIPLVEQTGG